MTRPPELQKHDTAGPRIRQTADNGTAGKTVLTDIGAVDPAALQDRNRTFEPQIVRKGQTRLEGPTSGSSR
jgi:transposase-like protein